MHRFTIPAILLLAPACGGRSTPAPAPLAFALPGAVVILDGPTGMPVSTADFLRRLAAADLALLGEHHDNPAMHALRGRLITAFAARPPAIVFEQFAESPEAITGPAPGEALEAWLDRSGYDRASWKWPLHQPVVEAAIRDGRSIWGSGVSREALRSVVRDGDAAAPAHLRRILEQAPLDSGARAGLDEDLIEAHCGQLPQSMIPGMRAAQTVRDAAMAHALLRAASSGPAWLIAGNGHVRRDIAVPRVLRVMVPGAQVLSVGLLERTRSGGAPNPTARAVYDLVIVTPRIERPDPCASFQRQP